MERTATFLWMKDLLDHLTHCHEQWEDADPQAERHWCAAIERDLTEMRRLCELLRQQSHRQMEVAA